MPWIGTQPQPKVRRDTESPSLEHATTVAGRGTPPCNAVIESITEHECRLRTVVFFDRGEVVEFEFAAPGHARIAARGHVVDRTSKGPRFVYRIRLDRMSAQNVDELGRAVASTHRRQARERSMWRAVGSLPTTEALARASFRLPADFAIEYRTARERFKAARAADVSAGGLSIVCGDGLIPGELLELCFAFPSQVLDVHPEETVVLDLRTRSVAHARTDLRRPFKPLTVKARVVSHRPLGGGSYSYGLAFLELEPAARQEVTRYVEALDLIRRRCSL
ncbi:MAG TPA: PilZ domain-containing protein [Candidatus Acidoferrales bacterium]|nr:PilZ domain-containing protein [Candidatus Acidoferrales bacterium]